MLIHVYPIQLLQPLPPLSGEYIALKQPVRSYRTSTLRLSIGEILPPLSGEYIALKQPVRSYRTSTLRLSIGEITISLSLLDSVENPLSPNLLSSLELLLRVESIGLMGVTVSCILLLQKPNSRSKAREHSSCLYKD